MSSEESAAVTDPASQVCKVCGVTATFRCTKCVGAYYCGKEHQVTDWKAHKQRCGPQDGDTVTVSALLLPVDEDEPRIVKIDCSVFRESPDSDKNIMYRMSLTPFLGGGFHARNYISSMGEDGPRLKNGHGISLFIRDNFLYDGSKPNRCVINITNGDAPHNWAGPAIALKQENPFSARYLDMTMDDLPAIIKHLKEYGLD
ncbi:hypothetical protein PLICRDRAFT_53802 [Plicaturopsis crispa FD-325 SS-3]|nr:hypothetical protein PLICRDRAFT_53802 [Plicaturopsis crispa FD-325 SS-3]